MFVKQKQRELEEERDTLNKKILAMSIDTESKGELTELLTTHIVCCLVLSCK